MGTPMPSATGVRLTLKINFPQELRIAGWSESYDLNYADIPTAIASLNSINAFITDRLYCLGIGPYLESAHLIAYAQPATPGVPNIRRNSIELFANTGPNPFPAPPAAGNAYNKALSGGTAAFLADFAPTVFLIGCNTNPATNPVYYRSVWLAGLPDGADESNTTQITEPNTLAAVQKFQSDLNGTGTTLGAKVGFSIRSVDRSGANPIKLCTAYNVTPNTFTVPNHLLVQNQPVDAVGWKTDPGGTTLRGEYLVGPVIDANTITLQNQIPLTPQTKLGGFRPKVYTFNVVTIAALEGFTKRNKGRPSGASVGRRRRPVTTVA